MKQSKKYKEQVTKAGAALFYVGILFLLISIWSKGYFILRFSLTGIFSLTMSTIIIIGNRDDK